MTKLLLLKTPSLVEYYCAIAEKSKKAKCRRLVDAVGAGAPKQSDAPIGEADWLVSLAYACTSNRTVGPSKGGLS